MNGAAIYVGLTRGKLQNTLVLPPRVHELREQIAGTLALDAPEATAKAGRHAARVDLERAACTRAIAEASI